MHSEHNLVQFVNPVGTPHTRNADRKYNGVGEGVVGPTERKLLQLGEVRGVVAGNWWEVSEATHALLAHLATSRVRVAGPTRGQRFSLARKEGECWGQFEPQ